MEACQPGLNNEGPQMRVPETSRPGLALKRRSPPVQPTPCKKSNVGSCDIAFAFVFYDHALELADR